jgi:dTDP-4-dehydrorhamnose 3,5-epimerase
VRFIKTNLKDVYCIELRKIEDERGFFARALCANEFRKNGLNDTFVQANIGYNFKKGTLRGFHYQVAPSEEAKLIRCISGAIYDVLIDLRPTSPTYHRWEGYYLRAEEYSMLFIPKGFAHAYMTLEDNTEVYYSVSEFYSPESERGIRWNDPAFQISWPEGGPKVISKKDNDWEDYKL